MVLVILVSANSDWTWKMKMMYLLYKSLSAADIDRIAQSVAQVLADRSVPAAPVAGPSGGHLTEVGPRHQPPSPAGGHFMTEAGGIGQGSTHHRDDARSLHPAGSRFTVVSQASSVTAKF